MTDDVFAHGGGDDGEKFGCIVDAREALVLVDTSITPVPPCVVSIRYMRAVDRWRGYNPVSVRANRKVRIRVGT